MTEGKFARQSALENLIKEQKISSQHELMYRLNKLGFNVSQATVSRDIKEMGIVKTTSLIGGFKYFFPDGIEVILTKQECNLYNLVVLNVLECNNTVIISTVKKSAKLISEMIKKVKLELVKGIVSDDDTVIIYTDSSDTAKILIRKLQDLFDVVDIV